MARFVLPAQSQVGPAEPGKHGEAGFSMLEVLISMFIILVGLLGLAGLIVRSQQTEMESYQRVQALMLVQDMADRINANRKNATNYVTAGLGTGNAIQNCTALTNRAAIDLCEWNNRLLGSAEKLSGTEIGAMIGARGCVTYDAGSEVAGAGTGVYTVSVVWQGLAATASSGNTCGQGQYGNDTQRRVVTATVRIGGLS